MKNKHKKVCAFAALCLSLAMCIPAGTAASANSAQMNWAGSYSTGVIVTDEDCPVEVESEILTFDIDKFPSFNYDGGESDFDSGCKVTALYNFYNPADYTVTMTLAFPFGSVPDYVRYDYSFDDTEKYRITANGEEIQKTLRHTVADDSFNTNTDIAKLRDGFVEDEFFSPELTVTKYVFEMSGITIGNYGTEARLTIPKGYGSFKLMGNFGYSEGKDTFTVSQTYRNGDAAVLYVIGDAPALDGSEWEFYSGRTITTGNADLAYVEQTTFGKLALANYDEDGVVSKTDWYNAVVDVIRERYDAKYFVNMYAFDVKNYLMRWYVYSLTLAPQSRLVNEVTAPMYPHINANYNPEIYTYEYLLSPAETWADFGSLEIRVNTPFFINDSTVEGFVKTNDGYILLREGLPDSELILSVCGSPSPKKDTSSLSIVLSVIAVLVMCVLPLPIVFILLFSSL